MGLSLLATNVYEKNAKDTIILALDEIRDVKFTVNQTRETVSKRKNGFYHSASGYVVNSRDATILTNNPDIPTIDIPFPLTTKGEKQFNDFKASWGLVRKTRR